MISAPCPRHHHYAGVKTALYGPIRDDGPDALELDCGCEVRIAFFEGEPPFDEHDVFPEDEDIVQEALYDVG